MRWSCRDGARRKWCPPHCADSAARATSAARSIERLDLGSHAGTAAASSKPAEAQDSVAEAAKQIRALKKKVGRVLLAGIRT